MDCKIQWNCRLFQTQVYNTMEKEYRQQQKKKMGIKYYCIEDFHISIDSNQSEMYSYATNVTAPAGADFTKEGKRPL